MVRKLGLFALFGFLAIILAGPLLGILAVMLTFALIGFLIWLPLCALFAGNRTGWRHCLAHARWFWHQAHFLCQAPFRTLVSLERAFRQRVRGTANLIGALLAESCCGAVVGGFLVYLSRGERQLPPIAVVTGALVGAVVGMLVVVSRRRSAPERFFGQAPDGLD
jgi:hypothetical protein